MEEIDPKELEKMGGDYRKLIASQKTMLLSTASLENLPEISFAPYVRDETGTYSIFVSELARHTANLLQNPRASILFIRPESESKNLFARERAVFRCRVKEVARDDENYPTRINALQEKFGDVVGILRTLPDFHLFALTPESAQYVVGFGQAFKINLEDDTLQHITGRRKD